MGTCYICSRSELFRTLYIASDDRMILIAPPDDFTDWFKRGLPENHMVVDDIGSIPAGEVFDHIIVWKDEIGDMGDDDARKLISSYSGKRGIWLGLRSGEIRVDDETGIPWFGMILKGPVVYLSTDHDLFRVVTKQVDEAG